MYTDTMGRRPELDPSSPGVEALGCAWRSCVVSIAGLITIVGGAGLACSLLTPHAEIATGSFSCIVALGIPATIFLVVQVSLDHLSKHYGKFGK